jgi:hypothetical protein
VRSTLMRKIGLVLMSLEVRPHCHICAGTGLAAATSAPGPGSPLPHLRRDRARRCHICAGTGLAAATSAPGLGSVLMSLEARLSRPRHSAVVRSTAVAALPCD